MLLPPVGGQSRREPELLTHREPELDEALDYGDSDSDSDYDQDPLLDEDQRRLRKKKIWRRVRRMAYVGTALMIILPIIGFFIAYQVVDVPTPEDVAAEQNKIVTMTYSDGEQELTRIAPEGANRVLVEYEGIPKHVLHAVYSAEDKDFMTNAGFDITGVLRAGWNQVTGGSGGGSTITQQYIKKSTGHEEKTYTRKALEVVKAYKMNRTYNKEDIIEAYLNTIYFGRNAYGVAAAAKSYYGKDLKDVNASEAALLAGMIQSPSRFRDNEYMKRRWTFVLDQMVGNGWLAPEERAAAQFPIMIELSKAKAKANTGLRYQISEAVLNELNEKMGLSEEDIQRRGYKIVTTIDAKAQKLALDAIHEVMKGEPKNLRPALVAIDPKSGGVLAYYGGETDYDFAAERQEPGSSFKPFDLVALLKTGKGLGETYDGTSPRTIAGVKVRNASRSNCGKECPVAQAMKESLNTVFYDMAVNTVGTKKVAEAAAQAGVRSSLKDASVDGGISIGGGKTQVTTVDMASAYATFAANGTYRAPHLVAKVLNADGSVAYQAIPDEKPAFDSGNPENNAKIARNVTEALLPVPRHSKIDCDRPHECAGKTGTHQYRETEDNAKAWMVGYVPQISTAVSMTAEKFEPIKNADGGVVYGSGLPGKIWQKFMNSYLDGKSKEDWPRFEPIGKEPPKKQPSTTKRTSSSSEEKPSESQTKPTRPTRPTRPTTTTETSESEWPPLPGDPGGPGGPGGGGGGGGGGDAPPDR